MKIFPIVITAVVSLVIFIQVDSAFVVKEQIMEVTQQYNHRFKDKGVELETDFSWGIISSSMTVNINITPDKFRHELAPMDDAQWANITRYLQQPLCMNYDIYHTPLAGKNWASYEGTSCSTGKLQDLANRLWPTNPALTSHGEIALNGNWVDETRIDGLSVDDNGNHLNVSDIIINTSLIPHQKLQFNLSSAGFKLSNVDTEVDFGPVSTSYTTEFDTAAASLKTSKLQGQLGDLVYYDNNHKLLMSMTGININYDLSHVGPVFDTHVDLTAKHIDIPKNHLSAESIVFENTFKHIDITTLKKWMDNLENNTNSQHPPANAGHDSQPLLADVAKQKPSLSLDNISMIINGKQQKLQALFAYVGNGDVSAFNWKKDLEVDLEIELSKDYVMNVMNNRNLRQTTAATLSEAYQQAIALSHKQLAAGKVLGFNTNASNGQVYNQFKITQGHATLNGKNIDIAIEHLLHST